MAKKGNRIIVSLACSQCRVRTYTTTKNRSTARLELRKYCPRCRSHQVHREVK